MIIKNYNNIISINNQIKKGWRNEYANPFFNLIKNYINFIKIGTKRSETTFSILIIGLMAGPAVSL